jgi:hypothetical protein
MILAFAACWSVETPFTDGLELLEDNTAPYPDGDGHPEDVAIVTGDEADYSWGHARAWVQEDVATVWACIRTPDVGVDRRRIEEWSVEHDTEPEYDDSYQVHEVSEEVITVEFDVAWRHGVIEGSQEEPTETRTRWQKVEGTEYIEVLEGSGVLLDADGDTEVQLIQHLQAPLSEPADCEQYLGDFYASLLACAHGEDLPTYDA